MNNMSPGGKVLDFGCGAGQVVTMLRSWGTDAYGCDVYYDGADLSAGIPEHTRPFIERMVEDRIPYPNHTFDCLFSNQVIEHVPDLALTASEMARVLKPGGVALHLFPDKGVWREAHSRIPFLHWFPKNSIPRIYYAAAITAVKLRLRPSGKTVMASSTDKCVWLDAWTHYRRAAEIHRTLSAQGDVNHIEDKWFDARFGSFGLPSFLKRWIVRKYSGMVLTIQY